MLQKSQHGKMFCVLGGLCLLCASCVNEIIDVSHAFRFFVFFFLYYTAFFFHIILFLLKDLSWDLSRSLNF